MYLFKYIRAVIYLLPLFVVSQNFYNHSFSGEIIEHSYFTLSYLEKHEQPEWVSYKLSPQFLKGNTSRTDNFRADNKVSTGSAQLVDYKGSGYDRGHLVPAGDMKYSYLSMSETFFLSNISPQNPSFNRGGWKKLESLVRGWASEKEIHIVTAGVLEDNLNRIGYNRVSVPLYFYKVIYSPSTNQMIGFVMPNKKINADLKTYVKTVDQVEDITGIDFFYDIQDDVENKLESIVNLKLWDFSKVFNSTSSNNSKPSFQCIGKAKTTGLRCRNKTTNTNKYCYVHQNQSKDYKPPKKTNYIGRCNAITKSGNQCKRNASNGNRFCWQHNK